VQFSHVICEDSAYLDPPQQRSFENIDAIICCVGYKTNFPFLDAKELDIEFDPRTWYKHCFPPGHDGNLAFIGYARGHQGGIPQIAEMTARYHALIQSGERRLPKNLKQLALEEGHAESEYFLLSAHLRTLVDYPSFCDSLAILIGCLPPMPNPIFDPAMFIKYWFYPNWACWYRLRGPGANPKAVDKVLKERFPLSKLGAFAPPPYIIMILLLPFTKLLTLIIHMLGFGTVKGNIGRFYLWNRAKRTILHNNK